MGIREVIAAGNSASGSSARATSVKTPNEWTDREVGESIPATVPGTGIDWNIARPMIIIPSNVHGLLSIIQWPATSALTSPARRSRAVNDPRSAGAHQTTPPKPRPVPTMSPTIPAARRRSSVLSS